MQAGRRVAAAVLRRKLRAGEFRPQRRVNSEPRRDGPSPPDARQFVATARCPALKPSPR